MKKGDLIHAIDAVTPVNELKARVLALPDRPSRPRLENPLRHVAALGTACVVCAGVVAAVMMLQNVGPGGNITNSGVPSNAGLAADPGTGTPSPTDTQTAPAATETPLPSGGEQTAGPGNDFPKLADIVKITEKDGKYYADERLKTIAAAEGEFGLDFAWAERAVNGDLAKEEILAEFALADERAANFTWPLTQNTLPEGILLPDEAISAAKKAYKDYGLDAENCVIIDTFSYSQAVVYGSAEPSEPLYRQNAFAGKKLMLVWLAVPEEGIKPASLETARSVWSFELIPDGAVGHSAEGAQIAIDAVSGEIIGKTLNESEQAKLDYEIQFMQNHAEMIRNMRLNNIKLAMDAYILK